MKIKKLVPISSLLLVCMAFCLQSIYMNLHWAIAKLYAIDAVNQQIRSAISGCSGSIRLSALSIALISIILAIVSLCDRFCNLIIGRIILAITVLAFLLLMVLVV